MRSSGLPEGVTTRRTEIRVLFELVVTPGASPSEKAISRRDQLAANAALLQHVDPLNYPEQVRLPSNREYVLPVLIPGATYQAVGFRKGKPAITKQFSVKSGEHLDLGEFSAK